MSLILDQFIADYAIRADQAEAFMAIPSLEIARKIVDIHVSRKEILKSFPVLHRPKWLK